MMSTISERSTAGAAATIEGPFGAAFAINPLKSDRHHVMIAGGCGISPFLSVLRSPLAFDASSYHLITVNTTVERSCLGSEVSRLITEKNIVHTEVIGHFTQENLPNTLDYQHDDFYVCGSQGFVDAVSSALVARGVTTSQVHYEQFYPSVPGNLTEEQFVSSQTHDNILFQAILESRNHVIVTDANGKIIFANPKAQEHTGYTFEEMRGNTPRLWGGLMSPDLYAKIWLNSGRSSGFDGELVNRRKNGEMYDVIAHISPIFDKNEHIIGYIGTEEDITDRVRLERAKTEFVSIASHQLRTPLGIVRWYIEALKEDSTFTQGTEKFQNYINQIQKNNDRILALVQDLLSVSHIDQGKVKLEVAQVDLVALVTELFDEMKILAVKQHIDFQLIVKTNPIPQLSLDGALVKRSGDAPAPVVTINVDSIDEYLKKVVAGGGALMSPKGQVPEMGYFAYFKDSEGNVIGLWEDWK